MKKKKKVQKNILKKQEEQNPKSNANQCKIYSFDSFKKEHKNYKDIISKFENQVQDIVCFLIHQAEEFDKRNISKTFLYVDERNLEIVGFFTIKIKSLFVEKLELSNELLKKLSGGYIIDDGDILNFYLIGQLGISTKYQGQSFGGKLLAVAIEIICETQDNVGGRYILVDALKNERVVNFYRKFGFKELEKIEAEETITMIAPIGNFRN